MPGGRLSCWPTNRLILDALPDPEVARANQSFPCSPYGVTKDCGGRIRLCFRTRGASPRRPGSSPVPGHLEDISLLDPAYRTIRNHIGADPDTVSAPELGNYDRNRIRHWYEGCSRLAERKIHTLFDISPLFRSGYLAIAEEVRRAGRPAHRLGYPN